jgi:histone deacetylase 1/2
MEYYGPRYKLEVLANNMDDQNTPEYLASIRLVTQLDDEAAPKQGCSDAQSCRPFTGAAS